MSEAGPGLSDGNFKLAADGRGGRSLSEAGPKSSDDDSGLGGDEGPTIKVVRGGVIGLVGLDSTMGDFGNVGGVSCGLASGELVGVTVGAIIGFEGAAFLADEVFCAGNCSKFVSVCVKLRTGTSTIGGLTRLIKQPFFSMLDFS